MNRIARILTAVVSAALTFGAAPAVADESGPTYDRYACSYAGTQRVDERLVTRTASRTELEPGWHATGPASRVFVFEVYVYGDPVIDNAPNPCNPTLAYGARPDTFWVRDYTSFARRCVDGRVRYVERWVQRTTRYVAGPTDWERATSVTYGRDVTKTRKRCGR